MKAEQALERLMQGNAAYLEAETCIGPVGRRIRLRTAGEGQFPFAVVIACSDSRVIPEAIFQCGIGDLFIIRVAGNVIGDHELGSILYAADHLRTPLILVLGHTGCGAVAAAMQHAPEGYIGSLTGEIVKAIGEEKDPVRASCLNAARGVRIIREKLGYGEDNPDGPMVRGALYDISTGRVSLLD